MSLHYTVRPISDRTPFAGKHQSSQFTVKWSQVLDLLEREVGMLRGRHLVIEVDVPEKGIRNDGMLRADAKAASPAVRIAFESKHGPITMATDRFVRPGWRGPSMESWQHNVYAVAKALEALRLVDRYGVTRHGEQYTGWKALPSRNGHMSEADALAVLRQYAPPTKRDEPLERLARWARVGAHPDRHDGDHTHSDRVLAALSALGAAGFGVGREPQ